MKPYISFRTFGQSALVALFILGLFTASSFTTRTAESADGYVKIKGTSTLHDWEMKSDRAVCRATFKLNDKGEVVGVTGIDFSMKGNTLKSGHAGMDKNCYKALNLSKYPTISFKNVNAKSTPKGANKSHISALGKLTINGKTKTQSIVAICTYDKAKNLVKVTGRAKFKMSDYGVDPPSFMMGTITTGDDIVLNFVYSFNQKSS